MNNDRLKLVLRFVILLVFLTFMGGLIAAVIFEFADGDPEPAIVAIISGALGALTGGISLAVKSFFPDSRD